MTSSRMLFPFLRKAGRQCALLAAFVSALAMAAPPSFESIRDAHVASDRWLYDRNGEPLQRIRVNDKVRRGEWVKLDDISPAMIDATLYSEDKRFASHGGVDWRAAASAALTNAMSGGIKRGASSISMQVAASLDATLSRGRDARSMSQKFDQAQAAWELEKSWSKQEIFETYLNTIYFRGELQGIAAASEQLFGKAPHGLDRIESAILAALIRSPQADRTTLERRACEVLKLREAHANCAPISYAIDRWGSVKNLRSEADSIAPHVVKYAVLQGKDGAPLVRGKQSVSIDKHLQVTAREAIRKHLHVLAGRNAHDAAVVVIDNLSGEVLAYVGSSGQLSEASDVDAARAPRQAGSTLKPFIYGLGIEKNILTTATLLDDSPFSVDVGGGAYTPQNYAEDYVGPVSVRTALASSLNVPAIRALVLVGVAPTHTLLKRAGLSTLVKDPEHYGYSLALGSADVNLLELTNAYRAIANGGMWTEARFNPLSLGGRAGERAYATMTSNKDITPATSTPLRQGDARQLFSEPTAWLLANVLSDRGARYTTFGFDNPLSLSHWAAVKTGTSKDMRDNWAIGFNSQVTVGVWVGNAQGLPMHNVTGISGAGPIWADVMEAAAQRFGAGAPPKVPAQIVKQRIEFSIDGAGVDANRSEYFIRGTEPAPGASRAVIVAREANSQGARIVSPTNGAIIAIDPDIPAQRQRITLSSGDAKQAGCWEVNGERLGCSEQPMSWSHVAFAETMKHAAQHTADIRLLDRDGVERDRVSVALRTSKKTVTVEQEKNYNSNGFFN